MGVRALGLVAVFLGWHAGAAKAAGDEVVETKLAECREARNGECLLRLAAFDEAATAFEQSAQWDRAARVRTQLGQGNRAYADALAFVKTGDSAVAMQTVAHDALTLVELLGAAGDEAKVVNFFRRYLRDFAPFAAKDSALVAHAALGALLMAQSCPVRSFHGGCVEMHREARKCPELCDEHGNCPYPIGRPKEHSTTYTVEIAVARRRDPRLLREAKAHLGIVVEARDFPAAERLAAASPARARALANARAEALLAGASPALDRFLAMGGVPEDLEFGLPTQWDSRCVAARKQAAYEHSSRRFSRWMREKLALMEKLRATYLRAATNGGPESAIKAAALYAFVMASSSQALFEADDHLRRCPSAGHIDGPANDWSDDIDQATSLCDRLANRYAIVNEHSRYCRIHLGDRSPPHAGRRSAGLVLEISPDVLHMEHARDDQEALYLQVPMSPAPPRERPRPPRVRCPKGGTGEAKTGVLQMRDGSDWARLLAGHPRFSPTLPDALTARFPPPYAK